MPIDYPSAKCEDSAEQPSAGQKAESIGAACLDYSLCNALHKTEVGIQVWSPSGQKRYVNPATLKQFGALVEVGDASYECLANHCFRANQVSGRSGHEYP